MAEYTQFVTLDSAIREFNRDMGYAYPHRYGEILAFARQGLRELDLSRVPINGIKYLRLPVVSGRAWIPDGLSSIIAVGVEIQGHIQSLLLDPNMIDSYDDCGNLSDTPPLNPDIPGFTLNSKTAQYAILYTGPQTSIGYPYNGIFGGGLYLPGMNRRKSPYGYYRIFGNNGYILLDRSTAQLRTEIVVACLSKAFTNNTVTWLPELAVPYLKAYVRSRMTDMQSDKSTKMRPVVAKNDNLWHIERVKLMRRINSISAADFYAAVNMLG